MSISPQQRFPGPPEVCQGVPKPDEIYDPFRVYPGVFSIGQTFKGRLPGDILIRCPNNTMEETHFSCICLHLACISTRNAEATVRCQRRGSCCPKRRSSSISGSWCENVCNEQAVWCSCIIMAKSELSRRAKLLINQSIYVPTLSYGHELWIMTKKFQLWIQAAKKL